MPPARTGILPVRVHPAIGDQHVVFHLLHAKRGNRVRNHYCPVCNVVVERDDLVRGYEFTKDC